MSQGDLVFDRADVTVPVLALNRPKRRNACTLAMWRAFPEIFTELAEDATVRAVIVTGKGGSFCAGADISEFDEARGNAEDGVVYEAAVERCYAAIRNLPKPTIAAIDGYCVGGGVALAAACDFRIADRTARFGIPAARLGIVYSEQECRALMALVGLTRAKEMLFSGAQLDAARAREIGFVDRLADGDALAAARAFARPMADNAPLSIAGAKLILNALAAGEAETRRDAFEAAIVAAMESEDYREGIRAFAEKRPPAFTGK